VDVACFPWVETHSTSAFAIGCGTSRHQPGRAGPGRNVAVRCSLPWNYAGVLSIEFFSTDRRLAESMSSRPDPNSGHYRSKRHAPASSPAVRICLCQPLATYLKLPAALMVICWLSESL